MNQNFKNPIKNEILCNNFNKVFDVLVMINF